MLFSLVLITCSPSATPGSVSPAPAPSPASPPTVADVDVTRAPEKDVRYALVVSFGSECCGIEDAAARALDGILARYPQKALGHTRGYWGKEGEVDECFTLDGLDAAVRTRFVSEVRAGVARKLVNVQENATCRADR